MINPKLLVSLEHLDFMSSERSMPFRLCNVAPYGVKHG